MTEPSRFDYQLPEDLIAATPARRRPESRLMTLQRESGRIHHCRFCDLADLLREGDLLVLNDARVIPARLRARRRSGGHVELLLVRPVPEGPGRGWLALVKAGGSLREGEPLRLQGAETDVQLLENRGEGYWTVKVAEDEPGERRVMEAGGVPLPPYVRKARRRRGLPELMPELDRERYQTVYAQTPGAVAAPTAGLHFTEELLERVRERGVGVHKLSLLVGPGTFRPVRTEQVEEHELEAERFHLPGRTARAVGKALEEGRRVVATGTTTCRVLEYVARRGEWKEQDGWTDLFIYPPFEFGVVGALITNFHLPRSTLLMLVGAFAGTETILRAYREAVREGYRFYSYGDAMFIQ